MENTNKTFAYARVSTADQNTARQLDALATHIQSERDLFIDEQSGKDFNRPEYQRMKSCLRAGDTVMVASIDRLGRNYAEILNEWRDITKQRNCSIVVLDMPLLDTRRKNGCNDPTGTLIADIVLQLLAYVAETERNNIHKRQMEGIASAMKRGQRMGRPKIGFPKNFLPVYKKWQQGAVTAVQAMRELSLKPNTFYRLVNEYRANQKASDENERSETKKHGKAGNDTTPAKR